MPDCKGEWTLDATQRSGSIVCFYFDVYFPSLGYPTHRLDKWACLLQQAGCRVISHPGGINESS